MIFRDRQTPHHNIYIVITTIGINVIVIINRVRMRRRHGHWTDSHEFKPRQVRPLRGHYAFTTPTRGTSSIQNNHFHDVDFFVTFARQGCLALLVYLRKTCYWYLGKGSNTSFQFCSSKREGSYPPLPSPVKNLELVRPKIVCIW